MQAQPIIHDGKAADLDLLADILSDSFANDPVLNWVIPMPSLYPQFFRIIIAEVYLRRGVIYLEEGGRGASLWLPPDEHFDLPMGLGLLGMGLKLLARKGLAPLRRMQLQGDMFAKHHPKDPHHYLQFIGCRLSAQGQGVGSALLKQHTRVCDEQSMPAYLESSNGLNVPLYERHGFEVTAQEIIPGSELPVWFMWREPRVS